MKEDKMKRMLKRRITVLIVCILVIIGFLVYSNIRNNKLLAMIDTTKTSLAKAIMLNSTNTNFIEIYNTYNQKLLDNKIQSKKDKLSETELRLNYKDIESDIIGLSEYIKIDNTLINNKDYSEYKVKTKFIEEQKKHPEQLNISFKVYLETTELSDIIHKVVDNKVNINMQGAKGKLVSGQMTITDTGKEGRRYNNEALNNSINNLSTLDYFELLNSDNLTIDVKTEIIAIYPTKDDLLDIKSKISTFTTGYSSSGASRKQNIAIGAKNLNGTLLLPGEVLSVDKDIKNRNASNGYAKAGSYLNGKTVQTYGGGVCQVSTTLYGAVLRAGLIPIERNAHSMSVSYVPLGLDAAISEGYKDLKIENTYDSPIYIEAIANGSNLTFSIYGKEGLLDGYSYTPGSSSSANGLKAKSWLNKIKEGKVVEKINLFSSSYRPHS